MARKMPPKMGDTFSETLYHLFVVVFFGKDSRLSILFVSIEPVRPDTDPSIVRIYHSHTHITSNRTIIKKNSNNNKHTAPEVGHLIA